ncbi:septum site-determining protein Ssd [Parasphingorhabdus pacifica]
MVTTRPLLITQDAELADEVSRLAAAANCEPERLEAPSEAGGRWREAPLVLLDEATAVSAAATEFPRRPDVFVLCRAPTPDLWRAAFEIGAEQVFVLPDEEAPLVESLAEVVDASARHDGRVVAVVGGCGGAGASALATATAAIAAHRGDRSLLLDCDSLGGGLDLTVGVEEVQGLRWSGLTVSGGRVAVTALHDALPERKIGSGRLTVLACDRDGPSAGLTPEAVRAVVAAGRRAGDTVVCDLPRSLPEAAKAGLRRADMTVIVVPAAVRACAAAARLAGAVAAAATCPVRLVVRGPAPGGLRVRDVERAVGLDAIATMRPQPDLPAVLDRHGFCAAERAARGPVSRAAKELLTALDSPETPGATAVTAR